MYKKHMYESITCSKYGTRCIYTEYTFLLYMHVSHLYARMLMCYLHAYATISFAYQKQKQRTIIAKLLENLQYVLEKNLIILTYKQGY